MVRDRTPQNSKNITRNHRLMSTKKKIKIQRLRNMEPKYDAVRRRRSDRAKPKTTQTTTLSFNMPTGSSNLPVD